MEEEKDIYLRIQDGEFDFKGPFPKQEDYTTFNYYKNGEVKATNVPYSERIQEKAYIEERVIDEVTYKEKKHEYYVQQNIMHDNFKKALFEYYEVSDSTKRFDAYRIAEERGHGNGYIDIASVFSDLVCLIKE